MTRLRILAPLRHFGRDNRGAAGAEMALILPMLMALMFGGFEAGAYFWTEHKVIKGVRDGARFAARQPFAGCASPTGTRLTQIQNLTRTGQLTGGTPKVSGWANGDVIVTVTCVAPVANGYSASGLYKAQSGGAPHVTVSTRIAYPSLFQSLGFDTEGVVVRASANAAVTGA